MYQAFRRDCTLLPDALIHVRFAKLPVCRNDRLYLNKTAKTRCFRMESPRVEWLQLTRVKSRRNGDSGCETRNYDAFVSFHCHEKQRRGSWI